MKSAKLIIVNDHAVVRAGVESMPAGLAELEAAVEAANGREAQGHRQA